MLRASEAPGAPGAGQDSQMVTLDDVAEAAGVSRTTASRAMNGISTVHPDRVAAVRSAADRLGFRPNPAARSLARGRHDSVALIVPETDIAEFTNSFFSIALHGAIREIAKTEMQMIMVLRADGESDDKFLRYLASSHVDGAMVILESHNTELPSLLDRATVPVVYLGRPGESATSSLSYVDADNVGGGRIATEALLAAGRRRIGVITGPIDMGVTQDRLTGWSGALQSAGLGATRIAHGDFHTAGGARAMSELLRADPDIDAVFSMSDIMAAGAMSTLRAAGRSVPEDLSVVSFDDTVIARTMEPGLTTVRQPLEDLGALMVRTLAELIESPEAGPFRRTLPTVLIERGSV